MSTYVAIQHHDTPPELYRALTRVFGEQENNGTRWATLTAGEVTVTFFALREPESDEPASDELAPHHDDRPDNTPRDA